MWRVLAAVIVVVGVLVYQGTSQLRAVAALHRVGGFAQTEPAGPQWLPDYIRANISFQTRLAMLVGDHITNRALAHCRHLKGLIWLRIQGPQIDDQGLAHVQGLTGLTRLMLVGTSITDSGLAQLKRLKNLQELGLKGPLITDAGLVHLAGLTNLNALNLIETRVTDDGLPRLESLKKLKVLDIGGSPVTDAGIAKIRDALPQLETVYQSRAPTPGSEQ